jgi:hypothetical protein
MIREVLAERKYLRPRLWSNGELAKIAHLFKGIVLNVSGWNDLDKNGRRYKDYFCHAKEYFISNFKEEARGMQGLENEFFLDLTAPLKHKKKYDVVFNHTTLEHIYDVKTAFKNLCSLSNDVVIVVVPFLQPMHGDYGDYWRFSPSLVKQLFEDEGMTPLQVTFNNHKRSAVYVFAIASRHPERWVAIPRKLELSCPKLLLDPFDALAGCRSIVNPLHLTIARGIFFVKDKLHERWSH